MSPQIIGLQAEKDGGFAAWLGTPAGNYLTTWVDKEFERSVADIFGFHAVQLGLPELSTLRASRIRHTWQILDGLAATQHVRHTPALPTNAVLADYVALPFPEASLDLVTMPHTFEVNGDPHDTLREVHRVLVPEGKIVISGLNPLSLWGFSQQRGALYHRLGLGEPFVPQADEWIGHRRLRDWLRLLSFEVESVRFGCHGPAVQNAQWLDPQSAFDRLGARWWPIFGATYFVVAVKRVRRIKFTGPMWKPVKRLVVAPVPLTNAVQPSTAETRNKLDFD
jgi:SAM-dependent methyltransferase